MRRFWFAPAFGALLAGSLGAGCLATTQPKTEPLRYRVGADNTMVWMDEFAFARPPAVWGLVQIDEGDEFAFAFIKRGNCPFPCQSTFAYDEEPFGYATDLSIRMDEFYKRFLWATQVRFGPLEKRKTQVLGGEGLEATAEGTDPVLGHKVWSKVVLGRRGDRVVAFYLTQWRSQGSPYASEEEKDFDAFVRSFRFLKKSFYETL